MPEFDTAPGPFDSPISFCDEFRSVLPSARSVGHHGTQRWGEGLSAGIRAGELADDGQGDPPRGGSRCVAAALTGVIHVGR